MNLALIIKLIKFCLVGGSGMVVDFGLTWLFKEIAKINKYIANTIGFIAAATSNYFLNRIWTFHSQNTNILIEYTNFLSIALIGLLINLLVIWFLVTRQKYNFYLSKLIAIIIVTIWNFFINLIFTFNQKL
ncbi:MAG: GtrA family protein [Bacteroidales bacterium]|nr:GtrA family protein [Bacteroidales bacterium]